MALVLANRVQESGTANTTVSFTLTGAIAGFQSFAVIGNGNTTYYSATDGSGNWEVGLGTYSTTGPTLDRTTVYASSNTGSAVTFSGPVNVFVTYPSGKSVNLDASGNVSSLGTVASGTWQGSTVGVAYGGTGVTSSSGANSVVLRDANQNIAVNRLNQANTDVTAAGGTTALTAASSYSQTLIGTGSQTFTMPDATTLTTGVAFIFNNNATGTVTLQDYASGALGTITSGGAVELVLLANGTVAGTWDIHGFLPENVTWGTNALNLGSTVISNGTWQGGTIQPGYGGTGLTTFVGANNALYSTGASTLTAGTLPVAAGGTGLTATPTNGQLDIGNGTGFTRTTLTQGTGILITNGAGSISIAATGADGITYVTKTANYTAANNEGVLANTAGGAFTVTLPATPQAGWQVIVADDGANWGTNNLTVGRNGSTINGLAENLVCDISGVSVQLVYDGATWNVYAQIGGNGGTVVTEAGTQTLTNKTIAYANNTLTGVAGTAVANTFTATQTFSGTSSTLAAVLSNTAEVVTISATAATGTINYDVTTQPVLFYTSNAGANWTVNLRGSSGTSINTLLSTGQSVTVVFMVTQGATPYYNTTVQVDGTTSGVTTRWQGGSAPTSGNASGIDVYSYTVIKTASATFTVLASQTQFK